MKFYPKRAFALALVLATPVTAFATNGMFMIGQGVRAVGMGGTSIAFPQDALSGAVNPAGIGAIGTRIDIEGTLFLPSASATLGGIHATSNAKQYLLPGLGFSMPVDNETTFGFSMVGAGGGGTNYRQNLYDLNNAPGGTGAPHTGNLGVELMIMQMNPTMAQKFTPNQTVGFSLVMGLQRFKAFGLGNFAKLTPSGTDESLTDRGVEYSRGMGVRLGWLGKFLGNKLNLGAVATSKIYMTKFQNYSELFAENGDIDTPANVGAGIAFMPTPKLAVALDITRTYYSKVRAIGNQGPNTSESPPGLFPFGKDMNATGKDSGLGFGWGDQTVYKLGVNYDYNSKWAWRAGWNYGKSPIKSEREIIFNIVAPATTQHHATLGATYKINREMETSFAYMRAFEYSQTGPTYLGDKGTIRMSQNSFGASLGFAF